MENNNSNREHDRADTRYDNNNTNRNDRRDNNYNRRDRKDGSNHNRNDRKDNNYNRNDRKDNKNDRGQRRKYDKRNDSKNNNTNNNKENNTRIENEEKDGIIVNNSENTNNTENNIKEVKNSNNSENINNANNNDISNENIDKNLEVNNTDNAIESGENTENCISDKKDMSTENAEDIIQSEDAKDNISENINADDSDEQGIVDEDSQENQASDLEEDVASSDKLITVIGVRFRAAGKIYFFDPLELEICVGDNVIVETARGIEYGQVVIANKEIMESEIVQPLKSVIRVATPEDDEIERKNKEKEKEAFGICLEKIRKHGLEMKLIDSEYTFDNNKVLFYFTADGRIDFRELVKDLAAIFKTRIELRQIGVRDETKILGGIGSCGRMLCCNTYLPEFAPVSIKMAKEQNLSLNPTKISGVCGRLMCCLKNEQELYEEANSKMPEVGEPVTTNDGLKGEVHSISVLKQMVRVVVTLDNDEKEARDYHVDDLKFKMRKRNDKVQMDDELKKLEMLERKEGKSLLDDE